jgi:hypothetical protein
MAVRSWDPELDQAWLHVWLGGSDGDSEVGEVWRFWTLPPYLTDMEDEIRRRSDGQPYTPEWGHRTVWSSTTPRSSGASVW